MLSRSFWPVTQQQFVVAHAVVVAAVEQGDPAVEGGPDGGDALGVDRRARPAFPAGARRAASPRPLDHGRTRRRPRATSARPSRPQVRPTGARTRSRRPRSACEHSAGRRSSSTSVSGTTSGRSPTPSSGGSTSCSHASSPRTRRNRDAAASSMRRLRCPGDLVDATAETAAGSRLAARPLLAARRARTCKDRRRREPRTPSEYGIRGIPAIKAFGNGLVVSEFVPASGRSTRQAMD